MMNMIAVGLCAEKCHDWSVVTGCQEWQVMATDLKQLTSPALQMMTNWLGSGSPNR